MTSSVLAAALTLAIGLQEPFHARRLGDKPSPPATQTEALQPDFSAWEEKAAFTSFKLVAVEARAVHFDGLSFIREGDDVLRIYLLLRDSKSGRCVRRRSGCGAKPARRAIDHGASGTSPTPLTFLTRPCSASFSADVMRNSALLASQYAANTQTANHSMKNTRLSGALAR